MIQIELSTLINKLSPQAKAALEQAGVLCISRQNPEVTVAHFLLSLLDDALSDVRIMINHLDLPLEKIREQTIQVLSCENHHISTPAFSPLLVELLKDACLLGSTELNMETLRSGVIYIAMLMRAERYFPRPLSVLFQSINKEQLRKEFASLTLGSLEAPLLSDHQSNGSVQGKRQNGEETQNISSSMDHQSLFSPNTAIQRFCVDLTEHARNGELDPVLCRDDEMDMMIDILSRRRKNSPILVGEAGVGKSAVLEGLALRIVAGNVPAHLQNNALISLDLGLLQAGASMKGEFEKRLKNLMAEITNSPTPTILFIDEAHTLIGAGNQEGSGDAANLLKPALARGELRTIAATTWKEYKKYIEKDPALSRRFQLVKINEPSIEQAIDILRGLHAVYENTHQVMISDEALRSAVEMSARYLTGRQLPDKAIDVLDTACARIAINQTCKPKIITDIELRTLSHQRQLALMERQYLLGENVDQTKITEIHAQIEKDALLKTNLMEQWNTQKAKISDIVVLRQALMNSTLNENKTSQGVMDLNNNELELIEQLKQCYVEFDALNENNTLIFPHVGSEQIANVIADWTGIPVSQMQSDELKRLTTLPALLDEKIKGQSWAISHIHRHLLTSRADLRREGCPKGVFLLVGPSGVGKTETVVQIAELLYGSKQFLTTINMSEYQEKHTVSRLIGAPAGYVGYGEGGLLTEAIRKQPYSIVLLDEVEKAHPDVLNLFYQAFDKGELADGEGRTIDCQHILFFMTSNLGYQTIVEYAKATLNTQCEDKLFAEINANELDAALYPELLTFFKPALLARMEVVPYFPLTDNVLQCIIEHKLSHLSTLMMTRYRAEVSISEDVITEILRRTTRTENGARMLESIIDGQVLPNIAQALLEKIVRNEKINHIQIHVKDQKFVEVVS